ncbi:MAG TPA: hypothetical protein VD999_03255 [Vitreimonas sp.]|nr:hypothetical protein [Vitreimonas sp.]
MSENLRRLLPEEVAKLHLSADNSTPLQPNFITDLLNTYPAVYHPDHAEIWFHSQINELDLTDTTYPALGILSLVVGEIDFLTPDGHGQKLRLSDQHLELARTVCGITDSELQNTPAARWRFKVREPSNISCDTLVFPKVNKPVPVPG